MSSWHLGPLNLLTHLTSTILHKKYWDFHENTQIFRILSRIQGHFYEIPDKTRTNSNLLVETGYEAAWKQLDLSELLENLKSWAHKSQVSSDLYILSIYTSISEWMQKMTEMNIRTMEKISNSHTFVTGDTNYCSKTEK